MVPIPLSSALRQSTSSDFRSYEKLFRSPLISSCDSPPLVSPLDPIPLTLNENSNCTNSISSSSSSSTGTSESSVPKGLCTNGSSSCKCDTAAALLLTSIKKLHVEQEPLHLAPRSNLDMSHVSKSLPTAESTKETKEFRSVASTYSKIRSALGQHSVPGKSTVNERLTTLGRPRSRVRTVSLDLQHIRAPAVSDRTVDASYRIPKEKISLDLTTDLNDSSAKSPAQVSPPSSPVLTSIRDLKRDQGPRRLAVKKRTSVDVIGASASATVEPNKKRRKQQHKPRPSILRPKYTPPTTKSRDLVEKKVLRKKFSWKSYPELEDFLIANREEYLRHSAMNYTSQQKEYNNRLTERLLELATDCGYVFDEESFSFVSIRDRIRCYFKSYVQSKKKRGLILGYAARRKGLITEEELEKSAGIKGTIVVPKKTTIVKKLK